MEMKSGLNKLLHGIVVRIVCTRVARNIRNKKKIIKKNGLFSSPDWPKMWSEL